MSIFDRLKTQKLLSFTMILFTLSLGVVIGTLVSSGVKAARSENSAAPDATPLTIPSPCAAFPEHSARSRRWRARRW